MKIAICVPSHSDPKHQFVQAFGPLLLHPTDHELKPFLHRRSPISLNRNIIAQAAMDWGAEALLWIDDDQIFPADALEKLVAHGKEIVGCNIAMRCDPTGPTAARANGPGTEKYWTTEGLAASGTVEEVAYIGLGFCLIKRVVFERIRVPWFAETLAGNGELVGEDCHFMAKASRAGFGVFVDHGLSWQIGHIREAPVWIADTIADRERFLAGRQDGACSVLSPTGNQ